MKNIFLTTATISLFSLPVLAVDVQFFIGANYSGANLSYTSEAEEVLDEMLSFVPDFYQVLGAEAGVKFNPATNDKVSFGGSIAYDYAFDEDAVVRYPYNQAYSDVTIGFSAFSAMTDAYFNFDFSDTEKGSLIFGVGYANVNQRVEMTATELAISNGVYSISEEDDGGAAVFKVGLSADIKNGFGIQTTLRYFVPTDDSDIKGAFLWGAGLRYTF